jgi:hypothetical protein
MLVERLEKEVACGEDEGGGAGKNSRGRKYLVARLV